MKKEIQLSLIVLFIILNINTILAINLDISEEVISNTVVSDINKPAIFNITITNLEKTDNFTISSLVGIDITPNTENLIKENETKSIIIYAIPRGNLLQREETIPFEYIITNSKNENIRDDLIIKVSSIKEALEFTPVSITPKSENIVFTIKNKIDYEFDDLFLTFNSAFFNEFKTSFPLNAYEENKLNIPLNKEKVNELDAGQFIINILIETNSNIIRKDSIIEFIETPNIEEESVKEGFFINRIEITKTNIGNVKQSAEITIKKSLFSYLFTIVKPTPTRTYSDGLERVYLWEKDLSPGEELNAVSKTNWFYPILIVLLAIGLFFIIKKSIERDILFTKKVSYVKTKGGEFALRITLHIKAKNNINKINIIDRLPHLVNLYEKFGAIHPDKVDMQNKRIEWNIESMNHGEERIFSYIIYSHKVGVVGRFELPNARIVYEKNNNLKEATSNRAFFINEPKNG